MRLPLALFFTVYRPVHALGHEEKHDFAFLVHSAEDQCGKPNGKGVESGQIGGTSSVLQIANGNQFTALRCPGFLKH